jgi:hypothetical protein
MQYEVSGLLQLENKEHEKKNRWQMPMSEVRAAKQQQKNLKKNPSKTAYSRQQLSHRESAAGSMWVR